MIHLNDIQKTYEIGKHPFTVIKGMNLKIPKGEFVAIMGPSGSGKSTLLQLLGGLDSPTNGEIFIEKTNIPSLSEKELTYFRRRNIGFIFQNYQLLPTMTVAENIAFPMEAEGISKSKQKRRTAELVQAVDLEDKINFFPSQLSGGQQQRVSIARALAMNPPLVLADEPTGNLDRKRGTEILNLLDRLHREIGLTIVMVTHDPYAARFAERILLLKDGEIQSDSRLAEGVEDHVMENLLAKLNA
ncbi:putative ABC transport system ATP-binding protein [Marininema mesophilum]|uniref:Putative ABC transport system ATP-binding protein n=1 Tax=Marininema mesophilum TaxID=1048340 RepID=A0A1H2YU40_9BACL|nr:ABC transporter ATP-binding protein [Marininema mesophilum]SDX08575.1 putative ABC transport system ATP-binding protein [Marininema mesophilum]